MSIFSHQSLQHLTFLCCIIQWSGLATVFFPKRWIFVFDDAHAQGAHWLKMNPWHFLLPLLNHQDPLNVKYRRVALDNFTNMFFKVYYYIIYPNSFLDTISEKICWKHNRWFWVIWPRSSRNHNLAAACRRRRDLRRLICSLIEVACVNLARSVHAGRTLIDEIYLIAIFIDNTTWWAVRN